MINKEVISEFFEGKNPLKYVVAIEVDRNSNEATLVINDPEKGKYLVRKKFKSFVYFTQTVGDYLYGGDRGKLRSAMTKFGITFKKLKTTDDKGYEPERMLKGFKYLAESTESFSTLLYFFKNGGVNIYQKKEEGKDLYPWRDEFVFCQPVEQFMIQTGIRLFKGMDDYNDIHRMQFDLETTGLNPLKNRIFQIGIKDNKPYEYKDGRVGDFEAVLETTGNDSATLRELERKNIELFSNIIRIRKPDFITGFNSEEFDWPFLKTRCEVLGIDFYKLFQGLDGSPLYTTNANLKLGAETVSYKQNNLFGFNIIDVSHSVRRAKAINSEIKQWSLKYITKFSEIAKPDRVYVPGKIIHKVWADKENDYLFNSENGEWFVYDKYNLEHNECLKDPKFKKVSGDFIIKRYLIDDLWETEQVDSIYNQASFLLSKIIPTTYMRSSTMGTAGIWQLIMMAWSYENDLAVPLGQPKKSFVGGLSRLLEVGYAVDVGKLDYAALYPNTEITHDIFPEHDISGVMKGFLIYIAETRDLYKDLKGEYEFKASQIKKELESEGLSDEKVKELKHLFDDYSFKASMYDKKQLPIKILANSFFGSFGAPYIFNWGDTNCAEETTCRGRQYLRLAIRFFMGYGMRPLLCDTDGVNFQIPESIKEVSYIPTGVHRFTKKNEGKTLYGLDAVVAKFNDEYMIGRMGMDVDDICPVTINFSRKNYANLIIKKGKEKTKLVGNTLKSNKMPVYIEEFINKGIDFLLRDDGYSFVELYYETVDNIINHRIPLSKIATKANVKSTIDDYKERIKMKNKAGNPMPRQAHMELALANDLNVTIGDTIYYINTGSKKTDGDIQTKKLDNGNIEVTLNCVLLPIDEVENNPDAVSTDYNVKKYLDMLNTRIARLLTCFEPDVRDKIIITYIKSKEIFTLNEKGRKVYSEFIQDRSYFTKAELKLCSGKPLDPIDQDDLELDLLLMDDREFEFWKRVGKVPNNMTEEAWLKSLADYEERVRLDHEYYTLKYKEDLIKFMYQNITLEEFNLWFEERKELPEKFLKKHALSVVDNICYITNKTPNLDNEILLCKMESLYKLKPLIETIDYWLKNNPKKKITQWIKKHEHEIDFNHYYSLIYGEEYDLDKIKYTPRIYKDYDALYMDEDGEVDTIDYLK